MSLKKEQKRLKVLYITRKYPPCVGGMENFSYNLFNNFDRNDIDIDLIKLGKKQINLIWFLPYAFFKTLFLAKNYDIIFCGDALLSVIGFFTKVFFRKKKVVVNVFGLDITYKNLIYQFYLKMFYNKFDMYISISKETDRTLQNRGVYKSTIITPGIDVNIKDENLVISDEDFRKKYSIAKDDVILITVGRLVKRKGVAWFLENVMPKLMNHNVKYLIVGNGDDRENIEKIIDDKDLSSKVQLLGRVTDEDLSAVYSYSDIFVMPNIHVENDMEGFGIVAAEASLYGLIVIASGIEGIKDAIINEKNGYLLESKNIEQYAEKITDISENLNKYKELSKEFRLFTKKEYDWKKICNEYVNLFNLLLNEGD